MLARLSSRRSRAGLPVPKRPRLELHSASHNDASQPDVDGVLGRFHRKTRHHAHHKGWEFPGRSNRLASEGRHQQNAAGRVAERRHESRDDLRASFPHPDGRRHELPELGAGTDGRAGHELRLQQLAEPPAFVLRNLRAESQRHGFVQDLRVRSDRSRPAADPSHRQGPGRRSRSHRQEKHAIADRERPAVGFDPDHGENLQAADQRAVQPARDERSGQRNSRRH